jgi:hypothetical protein
MNVFVRPGSKAELACRKYAAGDVFAKELAPRNEVISPGFQPRKGLNLLDRGGKIIRDLVYTNFFVGGASAWHQQDIQNIDESLSKAMSDKGLNNVPLADGTGSVPIQLMWSNAVGGPEGPIAQPH